MDININKMNLEDLELIKDVLESEFDNFWNYNILKEEILSENSYFIVAKNTENEIVGFAGTKIIVDEADVMNIVVRKSCRKEGIGSKMLENLINYSISKNLKFVTENWKVGIKFEEKQKEIAVFFLEPYTLPIIDCISTL